MRCGAFHLQVTEFNCISGCYRLEFASVDGYSIVYCEMSWRSQSHPYYKSNHRTFSSHSNNTCSKYRRPSSSVHSKADSQDPNHCCSTAATLVQHFEAISHKAGPTFVGDHENRQSKCYCLEDISCGTLMGLGLGFCTIHAGLFRATPTVSREGAEGILQLCSHCWNRYPRGLQLVRSACAPLALLPPKFQIINSLLYVLSRVAEKPFVKLHHSDLIRRPTLQI